MDAQDVKFSEWISKGFDLYKDNILVLILASLVAMLLAGVSGGILAGPMMAGLAIIALAISKPEPETPQVGTLFDGFQYFLQSFLFCLVWGAIVMVGMILLNLVVCVGTLAAVAGALALSTLLMFAPFLIVEKKMGFWEASMASADAVKPLFWPLLGFWLVASILGSVGGVVCGIGSIVTAPLSICLLAVAYRELGIGDGGPAPAPADGPVVEAEVVQEAPAAEADIEVKAPIAEEAPDADAAAEPAADAGEEPPKSDG